jgi:hypothetical protein
VTTIDVVLESWIGALRGHLERGALMELPPFELGHGTRSLPGETTVRIMLADMDDLEDPEGSAARDQTWRDMRRRRLLADFRWLRGLLG